MSTINYTVTADNYGTFDSIAAMRGDYFNIIPYYNSVRVFGNKPSFCYDVNPDSASSTMFQFTLANSWKGVTESYNIYYAWQASQTLWGIGTITIQKRYCYLSDNYYYYSSGGNLTIVISGYVRAKLNLINDGVTWRSWEESQLVTVAGQHNMRSYLPTDIPTKSGYTFVGWQLTDGSGTILNPGGQLAFYGNTEYTPEFNYVAVWEQDNNTNSYVKTGGSWVKTKKLYVKQSGSWKEVKSLYGKTGGAWKKSQ